MLIIDAGTLSQEFMPVIAGLGLDTQAGNGYSHSQEGT